MINRFLFSIDLFGISVPLLFNGKEKRNSKLGGVCSFLLVCFISWAIYNASEDFFQKKNPQTFRFELYTEDPKRVSLSRRSFPMGVQIRAPDSLQKKSYIDDSIYRLKVYQSFLQRIKSKNGTIEEIWTFVDIETEKCTLQHFEDLPTGFSDIEFENTYCISQEQSNLDEIYIQGSSETPVYRSLTILLSECENSTSLIPCAPKEVLDQYLEGGWFNVLYTNLAINTLDFLNPVSTFKDKYSTLISRGSPKTATVELSNLEMKTDSGWITKTEDTKKFIKVNRVAEYLQVGYDPEKKLMSCTFDASNVEIYYSRTYKKIQNILAEVGGLANSTFVIFLIIVTPYLKFKVRESLMNELFEINIISSFRKTTRLKSFWKQNTLKLQNKNILEKIETHKEEEEGNTYHKIPSNYNENTKEKTSSRKNIGRIMRKLSASSVSFNQPKIKNLDQSNFGSPSFENFNSQRYQSEVIQKRAQSPVLKKINIQHEFKSSSQNENFFSGSSDTSEKFDNEEIINIFPDATKISMNAETQKTKDAIKNAFSSQRCSVPLVHQHHAVEISRSKVSKSKSFGNKIDEEENIENEKPEASQIEKTDFDKQKDNVPSTGNLKREVIKTDNVVTAIEQEQVLLNLASISGQIQKKIYLSLWEYICSFFYKSKSLKKKLKIINKGIKNVDQRLDIINILKKLRELDKLKALLLDHDQLMLFNNLPKPEILSHEGLDKKDITRASFSREALKKLTFVQAPTDNKQIIKCHNNIKVKKVKTSIDRKLLEIFDEADSFSIL